MSPPITIPLGLDDDHQAALKELLFVDPLQSTVFYRYGFGPLISGTGTSCPSLSKLRVRRSNVTRHIVR